MNNEVAAGFKVQGKPIALSLGTAVAQYFSVEILNVTGDTVSVKYNGIAGNAPHTYDNFVALWQGAILNLDIAPLKKVDIGTDNQPGSIVLDDIAITCSSYTVAYGVGLEKTTVCATAAINAGGTPGPTNFVSVGVNNVGSTSLSVYYRTLPGYKPEEYKNWVGLWEGNSMPYTASKDDMVGMQAVTSDANEGYIGINNVTMKIKTDYTLVYFVGENLTETAALLYFNTADYAGC